MVTPPNYHQCVAVAGFTGDVIQKTGGSTFIISLPKNWVTSRGLGPGDVLFFTPRADGSLTVYAESANPSEMERRVVDVRNDMNEEHLFRRRSASTSPATRSSMSARPAGWGPGPAR